MFTRDIIADPLILHDARQPGKMAVFRLFSQQFDQSMSLHYFLDSSLAW